MTMTEVVVENDYWDGVNTPTVFVDFLGQQIRVGDHIVYATSAGSGSAKLTLGRVDAFQTANGKGEPYVSYGGYDYSVQPAVKLPGKPMWKIKIQPLRDGSYSWRSVLPQGGFRKVLLNSLSTVVKVDSSNAQFEEYVED
jgi:hypothetical protein